MVICTKIIDERVDTLVVVLTRHESSNGPETYCYDGRSNKNTTVPPRHYAVRLGAQADSSRGIAQGKSAMYDTPHARTRGCSSFVHLLTPTHAASLATYDKTYREAPEDEQAALRARTVNLTSRKPNQNEKEFPLSGKNSKHGGKASCSTTTTTSNIAIEHAFSHGNPSYKCGRDTPDECFQHKSSQSVSL